MTADIIPFDAKPLEAAPAAVMSREELDAKIGSLPADKQAMVLAEIDNILRFRKINPEELQDRKSPIIEAAVTYATASAAFDGGFKADHTGEMVWAGGRFGLKHVDKRDRALKRLTRLIDKKADVRSVELWGLASVAIVMIEKDGGDFNPEEFEYQFLKSLFRLIERDCETKRRGGWKAPDLGGAA